MNRLYVIIRRFLVAPFIIYIYDLVIGVNEYFIPINIVTILCVGILGIPGLILLLIILLIL